MVVAFSDVRPAWERIRPVLSAPGVRLHGATEKRTNVTKRVQEYTTPTVVV